MKRYLAVTTFAVLAVFGLVACGQPPDETPYGTEDDSAPIPTNMTEFEEIQAKVYHNCEGPNMLYLSDRGDRPLFVVPNDPRCAE